MATPDNSAPDPTALGAAMAQSMPDVTGETKPPAPSAPPAPAAPTSATPAPSASAASPEVDANNRPFDPARFLTDKATGRPKVDARGLYIPKSPGRGKGSKNKSSQAPAGATPPQTREPGLFDSAPPLSSSSSAGSASAPPSHGGGAAASFIPEEEPPLPTSDQQTKSDSAPKGDAPPEPEAGADDVAAVAVDLLAEGFGLVTGYPEEAEPGAKEGNRLRSVLGDYLRSKGIKTRGLGAVALAFGAWLLRTIRKPNTRKWARDQFTKKRAASADIIDVEARRVSTEPAAAPAPAPASPHASAPASAQERGAPSYSLTLPRR